MKVIILFICLIVILLCLCIKKPVEKFSNIEEKCDVYLISNKDDMSQEYKDKMNYLPLNPNDKVVRFNHSGNEDIIPDRTDIAVFRNNKHHYWGHKNRIWKNLRNSEVLLLGRNKNTESSIKELEKNNNKVKIVEYGTIDNKTESSGKIAINYLLDKDYIDKIYLIGFDFYKGVNNWHNFKAEENFVNNHSKNIIHL